MDLVPGPRAPEISGSLPHTLVSTRTDRPRTGTRRPGAARARQRTAGQGGLLEISLFVGLGRLGSGSARHFYMLWGVWICACWSRPHCHMLPVRQPHAVCLSICLSLSSATVDDIKQCHCRTGMRDDDLCVSSGAEPQSSTRLPIPRADTHATRLIGLIGAPQGSAQKFKKGPASTGETGGRSSVLRKGLDWSEAALYAHDPQPTAHVRALRRLSRGLSVSSLVGICIFGCADSVVNALDTLPLPTSLLPRPSVRDSYLVSSDQSCHLGEIISIASQAGLLRLPTGYQEKLVAQLRDAPAWPAVVYDIIHTCVQR